MQSQQSLNKIASNSGFVISLVIHAIAFILIYQTHKNIKIIPAQTQPLKIDLMVYKQIAAPAIAEAIIIPEPAPIQPPTPIEPVIQKKPEPPKNKPKQEHKKDKPKHEKPKDKKEHKKQEPKPEPIEIPTPTQVAPVAPPINLTPNAPATAKMAAPVEEIGEFNLASSAGDENFKKIVDALKKHRKYPKNAIKMRQQGVVEVRFIFKKDGSVTNIEVVKSSGYTSLDLAAIKCVEKASVEFPHLSKDYRISVPISFRIK